MKAPVAPARVHGHSVSQSLPTAQVTGGDDAAITGCTHLASHVQPGDAFVAIDDSADGHLAAQSAVERGARAIVCERYLPVFGVPQFLVEDSRAAYSQLCQSLVDHPSHETAAVGITGSYGKTSVAVILASIFHEAGKSASCLSNQLTSFDGRAAKLMRPTTAPAIAELLDQSVTLGNRHAMLELSAEVLRSQAASAVMLDVVCVTNLHADDPAAGRSRKAVREDILSAIGLLADRGMTVLNADDADCMRFLAEHDGPAITFGMKNPAEISATLVEQHVNEQTFFLSIDSDTAAVKTSIVGKGHVENCLAAAAVARVYGISLEAIAKGIEQVKVIPGVMQRLDAGLGTSVFVDRATAPVALGNALQTARSATQGKVISVVDDLCQVSSRLADRVIATKNLSASAEAKQLVAAVLAAWNIEQGQLASRLAETLTGIACAMQMADEGDVVVASGLGRAVPNKTLAAAGMSEGQLVKQLLQEIAQRSAA